jgi:xanthine/uracil permease
MKKIFSVLLQAILFLVVFAVGSFLHPINLHWGITVTAAGATRYFVADGLLLAFALFLLIVIIQAIRKRLCDTTWTVIAFVLAVALAYAMKLGFITRDI